MISHSFYTFLISLFILFSESSSKVAPDYIVPCPGLKSDCLKKNIQETIPLFVQGIPSLGINSSDPLLRDKVNLDLPGGLKIEFYDGVLTGFKKCIVDSVKYENLQAELDLHCNLNLKGKYRATGKVLLFSINGDGDAKIKAHDTYMNCKIRFEDRVRDGIEYREIKDYKVNYRHGQKVSFVFTNLFKGNPELSETVLNFLNENWKEILDEFGKPIIETIIRITFNGIKKFFHQVPKSEIYIE
ncbi:protein takeout-like [Danaus plexippus]|uniref:protein takeout-like n=1 Tax=Danaus plexippus TaxID=13037 RepID=UPI002AB05DD2|nr:protein takeout-like [Danaus plexippus]